MPVPCLCWDCAGTVNIARYEGERYSIIWFRTEGDPTPPTIPVFDVRNADTELLHIEAIASDPAGIYRPA